LTTLRTYPRFLIGKLPGQHCVLPNTMPSRSTAIASALQYSIVLAGSVILERIQVGAAVAKVYALLVVLCIENLRMMSLLNKALVQKIMLH
jgi:hypothetical protein